MAGIYSTPSNTRTPSLSIEGAPHTDSRLAQHVCVDHCGRHVLMAQKLLNRSDVKPERAGLPGEV